MGVVQLSDSKVSARTMATVPAIRNLRRRKMRMNSPAPNWFARAVGCATCGSNIIDEPKPGVRSTSSRDALFMHAPF